MTNSNVSSPNASSPVISSPSPHDVYLDWCVARPGASRYFDATGTRLHYLEWPGPAGAPCLLLIHGFMGHAHWWDFVAPALAENYRVIAMDLSGMGDSGYRTAYSLEHYIEEIASVIQQARLEQPVVIGHSFGGRCTILAAHAHPELIRRIIVVDSHIGFADEERVRRFNRESRREKKRYADLASATARFRLVPDESGTLPRVLDHVARHSLKQEEGAFVWKFDEAVMERMPKPVLTDAQALPLLRMPMDFVCGEHSVVAPLDHAKKAVAAARQGFGPVVIPAAHHHVPVGQPLGLVCALRALLAK